MMLEINLPSQISIQLRSKAIDLSHLYVAEVAWLRNDVFEVLRQLKGTNVAILGGDVLREHSNSYAHEYSNWFVDRQLNELAESYVERSHKEATIYVSNFPDPGDGSIAYVLVFKEVE